jgi:hypothetical protein
MCTLNASVGHNALKGAALILAVAALAARWPAAASGQVAPASDDRVRSLLEQVNALQLRAATLTVHIREGTGRELIAEPAAPEPPELLAATNAVTDAQAQCDLIKYRVLAATQATAEYKADEAALRADESKLTALQNGTGVTSSADVERQAKRVLRDKTHLRAVEQQALDTSADWSAANVRLQAAQRSEAAVRASVGGTAPPAATVAAGPLTPAEVAHLTAKRDRLNADIDATLRELRRISPEAADFAARERDGIMEEVAQLHAAEQQPGNDQATVAPVIRFSAEVPLPVRDALQRQLDDLYRYHDPAYAEEHRRALWAQQRTQWLDPQRRPEWERQWRQQWDQRQQDEALLPGPFRREQQAQREFEQQQLERERAAWRDAHPG